jgi:hypothetical protein
LTILLQASKDVERAMPVLGLGKRYVKLADEGEQPRARSANDLLGRWRRHT